MIDFYAFFIYLIAFALGSLVAWIVARQLYPASSEREAVAELTHAVKDAR